MIWLHSTFLRKIQFYRRVFSSDFSGIRPVLSIVCVHGLCAATHACRAHRFPVSKRAARVDWNCRAYPNASEFVLPICVLSTRKNRWVITPVLALYYIDVQAGIETKIESLFFRVYKCFTFLTCSNYFMKARVLGKGHFCLLIWVWFFLYNELV